MVLAVHSIKLYVYPYSLVPASQRPLETRKRTTEGSLDTRGGDPDHRPECEQSGLRAMSSPERRPTPYPVQMQAQN